MPCTNISAESLEPAATPPCQSSLPTVDTSIPATFGETASSLAPLALPTDGTTHNYVQEEENVSPKTNATSASSTFLVPAIVCTTQPDSFVEHTITPIDCTIQQTVRLADTHPSGFESQIQDQKQQHLQSVAYHPPPVVPHEESQFVLPESQALTAPMPMLHPNKHTSLHPHQTALTNDSPSPNQSPQVSIPSSMTTRSHHGIVKPNPKYALSIIYSPSIP